MPPRNETRRILRWLMLALAPIGIAGLAGMAYMVAAMPSGYWAWMGPGMMGGYGWMGGLAAAMMLVPILVLIVLVLVMVRMSGTTGDPRN